MKAINEVIKKYGIKPEGCFDTAEVDADIIRFTHLKTSKKEAKIYICGFWELCHLMYSKEHYTLTLYFREFSMIFPGIESYSIGILEKKS